VGPTGEWGERAFALIHILNNTMQLRYIPFELDIHEPEVILSGPMRMLPTERFLKRTLSIGRAKTQEGS